LKLPLGLTLPTTEETLRLLDREWREEFFSWFLSMDRGELRSRIEPLLREALLANMDESKIDFYRNIASDPIALRRYTSQLIWEGMESLERRTGISSAIVSLPGDGHATGGMMFRTPRISTRDWARMTGNEYVYDIFDPIPHHFFLVDRDLKTYHGMSAEEVLDKRSIARWQLVTSHYVLDAECNVLWRVETPLTHLFRDMIMPHEDDLLRWLQDPGSMPEGASLSYINGQTNERVRLTKHTKSGWFVWIHGAKAEINDLKLKTEGGMIGYREEWKTHRAYVAYHQSRGVNNQNKQDVLMRMISAWGKWEMHEAGSLKIWWNLLGHLSIESGSSGNLRTTQTGELIIKWWPYFEYRTAGGVRLSSSLHLIADWAPNGFPNIFYHIPFTKRNISHFNLEYEGDIWVQYKNIQGQVGFKSETLASETKANVRYALGNIHISGIYEKKDSDHPFISPGKTLWLEFGERWVWGSWSLGYKKKEGYGTKETRELEIRGWVKF
jgi:hypothetical protein